MRWRTKKKMIKRCVCPHCRRSLNMSTDYCCGWCGAVYFWRKGEGMTEEIEVTESCGCVGCDIGLSVFNGKHCKSLLHQFPCSFTDAERAAKFRPSDYASLSPEEQWEIDKQLGLLDWGD